MEDNWLFLEPSEDWGHRQCIILNSGETDTSRNIAPEICLYGTEVIRINKLVGALKSIAGIWVHICVRVRHSSGYLQSQSGGTTLTWVVTPEIWGRSPLVWMGEEKSKHLQTCPALIPNKGLVYRGKKHLAYGTTKITANLSEAKRGKRM